MHFCAVRVFAESILRYGLPPSFLVNIHLMFSMKFLWSICFSLSIGFRDHFRLVFYLLPWKARRKFVQSLMDWVTVQTGKFIFFYIFFHLHLVSYFEMPKAIVSCFNRLQVWTAFTLFVQKNQGCFPRVLLHGMNFCEDGTGPCQPLIKWGLPDCLLDQWLGWISSQLWHDCMPISFPIAHPTPLHFPPFPIGILHRQLHVYGGNKSYFSGW